MTFTPKPYIMKLFDKEKCLEFLYSCSPVGQPTFGSCSKEWCSL
ncbi:hypothetical protein Melnitz1EXVC043M_02 [Methylophilales phage Melnitz-1 EXVC043M]|nr:hypothetical protein Melnitz1EXVC043M_02 [Methylophilales phage Melnitz-1 EXVC043M]